MSKRKDCSWIDEYGFRSFGYFIQWSNDYGIVKTMSGAQKRIHKSDLTFEVG